MKLRSKFIIYSVIIHALFISLSLLLFNVNKYLFVAAEVLILISICVTLHLYRVFMIPINIVSSGIESIKSLDFGTKYIQNDDSEIGRLVFTYNEMIDRLREERVKQRQQHYFLERLINASPLGIIILDLDNRVSMINPTAASILDSPADRLLDNEISGEMGAIAEAIDSLVPGGEAVVKINGIQTYKCSKSHFIDRGFERHFILIEELTKEILASQKKAYEKIIRMMSHEINNSVGAINSILNSSLNYKDHMSSGDKTDFENAINVAIDRNNRLNLFMSNFASVVRIPPPVKESYDLHALLRAVQILLSAECEKRDIAFDLKFDASPFLVRIDVQQMEQVLVNICKNAIESIENKGTIVIVTSDLGGKRLEVIDTGMGIDPGQKQNLFLPFFSTKRTGQGIGLTITREILLNHGFTFNLEGIKDSHAKFWIDFNVS